MAKPSIYTVGGTVQANQNGIYITRQADNELLALCRERTFAYVLTPRQMGKSSLMVRTAERLTDEGIWPVIIDLTQIGTQASVEDWYLGFLTIIEDELGLRINVVQWWQAHNHLGVTQRLTLFFQKVVLVEVEAPIVIFVDEIDTTLSLDFTDDFFTAIRYLYVTRATKPEFHRLTFVLIGVATPSDLIRDAKRTPFNIGRRVDLTDFTFEETLPLAEGLELPTDLAHQVVRWVVKWTGGHPYLTQRLCHTITEQGKKSNWSETDVDQVVKSTFFSEISKQDNNLQFVRDMLTKRAPQISSVLTTYREIHQQKHPVYDEEQSLVKSHLKLSGIVYRTGDVLQVRNRVYKQVFDNKWIKENLPIPPKGLSFKTVFLICACVVAFTLGIRSLKWLQFWELNAYDQMLRLRPPEAFDERILLVTISEEDLQGEKWPLPDSTIHKMLAKLQLYHPRVIGLNIYQPQKRLAVGQVRDDIISVCKFSSIGDSEVAPPSISRDNVGFSNLIADDDGIIRRSLLSASRKDRQCTTSYSFAMLLAIHYLEKQGIRRPAINKKDFYLGKTFFPSLRRNSGNYENIDAKGRQILINYHDPDHLAKQVTLTQLLSDRVNPSLVKDKLVIIGTTKDTIHPGFYTPYSASPIQPATMSPVLIHTQIVSQILSAVLDGRPFIWYWPNWLGFVWVWGWSMVGGILGWRLRNPLLLLVVVGITLTGLAGICAGLFFQSGWIPIIPPIVALVISNFCIVAYSRTTELLQKNERNYKP